MMSVLVEEFAVDISVGVQSSWEETGLGGFRLRKQEMAMERGMPNKPNRYKQRASH